ncbi:hypothetical protein GF377_07370 [candidate division GN15 bacterium]|nr:hypothetical protein [candidate division GN15 bacterium]
MKQITQAAVTSGGMNQDKGSGRPTATVGQPQEFHLGRVAGVKNDQSDICSQLRLGDRELFQGNELPPNTLSLSAE